MRKLITGLIGIAFANFNYAQCPTASFTTSAPECKNTNVSFNNTSGNTGGGWNYQWDFDFGGNGNVSPQTSTSQNPTGIQYNGGGSYTVSFTITGNGCPSTTATMLVDIKKARADFGVSTMQACLGETVDVFNTGSVQGTGGSSTVTHFWDFGAGASPATSNVENPGSVTYSTAGAKNITHYVTINYGGGCGQRTDQVSQTIVINPLPSVTFTSTAPVCEGSSVDFTYTGSTSSNDQFNWDFGNGSSPAMSSTTNPTGIAYTGNGTKNVSLTVTNQYGCFSTGNQNITINQQPVADFTSTAPICTGLGTSFTNMGTTGASYSWSFGNGSTPGTSVLENPTNVVYSSAGNKVVALTTTLGTCSDVITKAITIHETPTVSFTSNAPQCVGSGVNFTNSGTSGANWGYTWDLGADATQNTSNSENPTGVVYTSGGTKTITFTIFDQFCTASNTQSITINSLPAVNAGLDTTICANTSVQIGGSAISGVTYSWTPSNSVVIDDATLSNPTVSPVANISEFVVTGVDGNNCSATDTVIVTMLDPLNADAGVDVEICRYDSIQVGASLVEGQIYTWNTSKGLADSTAPFTMVSPDSTTTYTLSVTDLYGCATVSDEVTVIVNQLPLANAGLDDSMTVNQSVQLVATGGVQYSWTPSMSLSNAGINNPVASPDSTTTYVVSVIDVYGCENTDSVTVVVITPSYWAPNAFSPDGDLINDVFYIRGDGIDNFEFTVFDQYGHLIFRSKDLAIGWDGSYATTGELLPKGAYVYHVSGTLTDGTLVNETGMVNLIR